MVKLILALMLSLLFIVDILYDFWVSDYLDRGRPYTSLLLQAMIIITLIYLLIS